MLRRYNGFTLLEMSIVIAIIALILGGGAVIFSASVAKRQIEETMEKMEAIQKGLLDFRRAFDRLPCPADATRATGSQYAGIEAATAGTCTGGTPAANYTSGTIVMGGAPIRTLRLPESYMVDGWGSRIMYAVDNRLTAIDSFASIAITDTTTRITIRDETGASKTTQAGHAIISYGRNRHGAFPRIGGATCDTRTFTDTSEAVNCHCAGNASCSAFGAIFVQRPFAQNTATMTDEYAFDDIVLYMTRADLRGVAE